MKDKFKIILERIKASPSTAAAVLLGAVVVLTAVVVVSITSSKGRSPDVNPNGTPLPNEELAARFELLKNQVKLTLFDHNVSKESVTENEFKDIATGDNVYTVTVLAEHGYAEPLRQSILTVFEHNRFAPLYSSGPYHLITAASGYKYEVFIEEKEASAAATPQIPVVVAPVNPVVTNPVRVPASTGPALPPKSNAKIALLIDDAGANLNLADRLLKQKVPLAIAILPHLSYSRETADLVRARKQTVFLHFPMEPLSYPGTDPGPGALFLNMPEVLIAEVTKQNVESLGGIHGANNHTGSAFTADAEKMKQALESLRPYTKAFVDSNTSNQSVALQICRQMGDFKCGINKKFLDNENDQAYIRQKVYEMAEQAHKQGNIIAIGHLRPDTITVLEETIPQLQQLGYQFVPISSLMY